jgi:predicted amidohydrolase YtcJ
MRRLRDPRSATLGAICAIWRDTGRGFWRDTGRGSWRDTGRGSWRDTGRGSWRDTGRGSWRDTGPHAEGGTPATRHAACGTPRHPAGPSGTLRAMTNAEHADLVLTGGRIFTADAAGTWAEALAVKDGRIVAVGGDRDVRDRIGPGTRHLQLRGRTVTPGFQDAHVHPTHGGLARIRCELHDVRGKAAYLDLIAAFAAANPDLPWILGGGWTLADFPGGRPHREDLDRVVPDRPVFLVNRDGHDAWVNTEALARAGIWKGSADPADGRIARDPEGTPMGTLHEGAMELVGRLVPPTTAADLRRALLESQRYLHSLGITAWQDAWMTPPEQAAYMALATSGELTARVVGSQWWERDRGLEQIDEMVERRANGRAGRFAATSVKLMTDGVVENQSASMTQPYFDAHGHATDNRGIDFIDPEVLKQAVVRLDALGFQPHFHALGDRAVRQALDAVEAARAANGWSDTRPHLAHLQVIHPDDLPRFRRLGALANVQPLWAVLEDQMEELTLPVLGPEVSARQYPFRSLRANGATMVMGSDWSVSTPDPFLQMEVAVTRIDEGSRGVREPFLPEQCLNLVDILTAATAGSAYANHLDETGTLAVGRLADLAILDRDLFDAGQGPIGETTVLATFVEGVAVHEVAGLD